jgi:Fe-S cluster assembly iron-binding protein IscA
MKVTITQNAKQQLIDKLGEEPTIRLNEVRTTGWGATNVYELAQVEQRNSDEGFKVDSIIILIDPLVISSLDGDVVIDHNNNYGFILKNNFEVLTFGMKLTKNS